MQKLITKEVEKKLPKIDSNCSIYTTGTSNDKVLVHYFSPYMDWYVTHYDPDKKLFYGLVKNREKYQGITQDFYEYGFFSLRDFEEYNSRSFLSMIERDQYWFSPNKAPTTAEVMGANS